MSTRSTHPPGTPSWVAVICPDDAEPAKALYSALFGWEYENIAGPDDPPFYLCSLRGELTASMAGSGNGEPGVWVTMVSVADRESAAEAVRAAGGSAPDGDTVEIERLGGFHRVEDPAGAEVHLMQAEPGLAQRVDEPGAWSMSTLRVARPSSVTPFYATVFGWQTTDVGTTTQCRLPASSASRGGIVAEIETHEGADATWVPDFRVADVDEAVAAALDHGGLVVREPQTDDAGVRTAELADPGGAAFTISRLA